MSVSAETVVPTAAANQRPRPSRYRDDSPIYGRAFWLTYVGNTAFTVAMALMYRYADFVLYLGGTEWITSIPKR